MRSGEPLEQPALPRRDVARRRGDAAAGVAAARVVAGVVHHPHLFGSGGLCVSTGCRKHFRSHIDSYHGSLGSDLAGGDQGVNPGSRPEIDNRLTGVAERGMADVVPELHAIGP